MMQTFPSFTLPAVSSYNDHLRWRYATKKFDPQKRLSQEQLDDVLESTRLAASSYGLQPYKICVITDPALRTKMRSHAWDQSQLTDASHLIAFCPYRSIDASYVDHFVELIAKVRGVSIDSLQGYRDMMVGSVARQTPEGLASWMRCQAYIALGFLLSAAAQHEIDACPMEGFDASQVDLDLELVEQNLTTVALCALGFRAADDAAASYKKVRFPKEELFLFKK